MPWQMSDIVHEPSPTAAVHNILASSLYGCRRRVKTKRVPPAQTNTIKWDNHWTANNNKPTQRWVSWCFCAAVQLKQSKSESLSLSDSPWVLRPYNCLVSVRCIIYLFMVLSLDNNLAYAQFIHGMRMIRPPVNIFIWSFQCLCCVSCEPRVAKPISNLSDWPRSTYCVYRHRERWLLLFENVCSGHLSTLADLSFCCCSSASSTAPRCNFYALSNQCPNSVSSAHR